MTLRIEPSVPRYVAVVGPADASLERVDDAETLRATAYDVGRLLAAGRAVVLCGGGTGVMAAVADGVADAGGTSIGVLAGADRADAHPALTFSLPTGLGQLRNGLLVRAAHAVVCVGGSWGTLSEVAMAVRSGVPVHAVHGWELPDDPLLTRHESAADAVEAALG